MPSISTIRLCGDSFITKQSPAKAIKEQTIFDGSVTANATISSSLILNQGASNIKIMAKLKGMVSSAACNVGITAKNGVYTTQTATITLPIMGANTARIFDIAIPETVVENSDLITFAGTFTGSATDTAALCLSMLEYPSNSAMSQAYNPMPQNSFAVTASDTNTFSPGVLYAGVQGDVYVDMAGGVGTNVPLKDVYLFNTPVLVKRVYATSTTATGIRIFY